MKDKQSRDEFEAWATRKAVECSYAYMSYLLSRHPETGDYNTTWVDSAWMGWQASREAIVIELPEHFEYDNPGEAFPAIKDCRTAIEAAGLKVSNT